MLLRATLNALKQSVTLTLKVTSYKIAQYILRFNYNTKC